MKSQVNKVVEEAKIRDTLNKSLAIYIEKEVVSPELLFQMFEQIPTHDSVKLHSVLWRNPSNGNTYILQYTMLRVVNQSAAHLLKITTDRDRKGRTLDHVQIADNVDNKEVIENDK